MAAGHKAVQQISGKLSGWVEFSRILCPPRRQILGVQGRVTAVHSLELCLYLVLRDRPRYIVAWRYNGRRLGRDPRWQGAA